MTWSDWMQLVPSVVAIAGVAFAAYQTMQRRREQWLQRQLHDLGVTTRRTAVDAATARHQLEPNGGVGQANPSTYDLVVDAQQRTTRIENLFVQHTQTPDAHRKSGGD